MSLSFLSHSYTEKSITDSSNQHAACLSNQAWIIYPRIALERVINLNDDDDVPAVIPSVHSFILVRPRFNITFVLRRRHLLAASLLSPSFTSSARMRNCDYPTDVMQTKMCYSSDCMLFQDSSPLLTDRHLICTRKGEWRFVSSLIVALTCDRQLTHYRWSFSFSG